MANSITLQSPTHPEQLILLFHGVGAAPQSMVPLGNILAKHASNAMVISVQAPDDSDFGQGFQWFSVQGVTEENRLGKIQATMPRFVDTVHALQAEAGVNADNTTLVGFSQTHSSRQMLFAPAANSDRASSSRQSLYWHNW